jgi:hypothetical protein
MRFNYTYRITYGSGQCCDRSREQLTIEITREQYGRIIEKVIQGCTISEVPGIEGIGEGYGGAGPLCRQVG